MRISALVSVATLSLAIAAGPLTVAGVDMSAMAKGGNGGGSHGGGNGGGSSHGNNGSQGSTNRGKSQGSSGQSGKSQGATRGKSSDAGSKSSSKKSETVSTEPKAENAASQLAGLNSLNRSYKAYMHTSDPRMTAIAAYAMAYAQYEIDNGAEPSVDDPVLEDAALEDALASATKSGEVSPAVLDQAKAILGVGEADGKIDQIRERGLRSFDHQLF